jgi:hypothetical protein
MRQRYTMFKRNNAIFFIEDRLLHKQESLRTRDQEAALRILTAKKSEAYRRPAINLQLAQVYLQRGDPEFGIRTWQTVRVEIVNLKRANTRPRWEYAIKEKAFNLIRSQPLLRTTVEHFLRVSESGTVSTNVHLRNLHNFALGMHWLPWPVLPRKQWPAIRFKEKRAITPGEHAKIIECERNPEMKAFYQLLWCLGGSQSDMATLRVGDINWNDQTIGYSRAKTGSVAILWGIHVRRSHRRGPYPNGLQLRKVPRMRRRRLRLTRLCPPSQTFANIDRLSHPIHEHGLCKLLPLPPDGNQEMLREDREVKSWQEFFHAVLTSNPKKAIHLPPSIRRIGHQ